ncbi:MAG TPA: catalase family peroxidase [Bordetella sp.]
MPQPSTRSNIGSLLVIAVVVAGGAAAFAYTAGWLSPGRVTPDRLVDRLAPPTGPVLGYRRNHAKGVCFTGAFEANGAGAALSDARVFAAGRYPVMGRFNVAGPIPTADDATARVRGMGLQIKTPDGQEWRSATIDVPFFPVGTVQAFYDLQSASATKDAPDAVKRVVAAHPEIAVFGAWAKSAPFAPSFADDRYNSLNSFVFTDAAGNSRVVRWSLVPRTQPTLVSADDMKARGPDFLKGEIAARVAAQPQRWGLFVTVAEPGDPTADPSKAWPASRRAVDVGTLVVDRVLPEPDGPCRDINFDPTVLPPGIGTSDDPFPAARSAAYAVSYNRRTAEAGHYPRTMTESSK